MHPEPHPFAGKTVTLNDKVAKDPRDIIKPGVQYVIRDWVDRLGNHDSWKVEGNWATTHYADRQGLSTLGVNKLPNDEEVVYGKIDGLGHCVHESELGNIKR